MAALAALGRRMKELGRVGGFRGVKSHPGAAPPPREPSPPPVEESRAEYHFVERLLPPSQVPEPPPHPSYPTPSGWSPPAASPPALPYWVGRSRMHNLPLYPRPRPRLTLIRRLRGDLWALARDVQEFLRGLGAKDPQVQVNEVTCTLRIKGNWERPLRTWLLSKGF